MKVTMQLSDLKTIFDACKSFVSKDAFRPVFQAVQLNFSHKQCTAYALDSVKMMSITVPYADDVEGSMLVPIIKLPKGAFVTLSDEGSEIIFDFGDCKQTVKKYEGSFIEAPELLFPRADPAYTIYFGAKNLKSALDGFKNDTVELRFFGPTEGCVIRGDSRKALVLPVKPKNIK